MKKLLLILFLCACITGFSQPDNGADNKSLEKLIGDFFLSLEKRDTALFKSTLAEGTDIWTVRRRNDSLITRSRKAVSDLPGLAGGSYLIEEKPFSINITLHRDIAFAWVPYTISVGGVFSHCGIDVFTFLRTAAGWKIVSMAYSIEPDGCEAVKKNK